MNSFYEKNISVFKKRYPEISKEIEKINLPENFITIETLNQYKTLKIILDKKEIFLHSKYNPISEAENIIKKYLKEKCDILILGGFGLGFLCSYALKNKVAEKIIVIEKDLKIFKSALLLNDISEIISHPDVVILFEKDNEIPGLSDILISSATKKVFTLIHPPSLKLYPEFYANLKNIIDTYLSQKNINIATLTRFQTLWIYNIFKNYKFFLTKKGVCYFWGKFNNLPAIIISAGPSLENYLDLIQKNQNRFIIIAVDSCFSTILRHNIIPDFVVTVDPQYINFKYFEYISDFSPILVAEPSVFPLILKKYKGRIIFFSSIFPFAKWLEGFTEKKGEIDMGGSVSTTAFDFAYKSGANPLIMVGQDLAFIKEKTHTKGSFVEKYWLIHYSKFNTILNGIYKYVHNNLFIKVKSNNNSVVNTDRRLMIFHKWFENKLKNIKNEREVFNTSLEGAKIENAKVLNLKEILENLELHDLTEIKNEIKSFNDTLEKEKINFSMFIENIKKIKNDMNALSPFIEDAVYLSEQLYEFLKKNKKNRITPLIEKLDMIDKKINSYTYLTEFLSLLIQDIIHTILQDYEEMLTEEEKNNNDLKIAKKNILLYSGIKRSIKIFCNFCDLIINDRLF